MQNQKVTRDDSDGADWLAAPNERSPENYPNLYNISAGLLFWQFLLVPRQAPPPPEYVHIPISGDFSLGNDEAINKWLMVTKWNGAWEAGPMRLRMFGEDDVPPDLRWLGDHGESDLRLVPDGREHPYAAYGLLFHLLPLSTLQRFGLPPLTRGIWPTMASPWEMKERHLWPSDFGDRLRRAVAHHLWPYLNNQRPSSFAKTEPITLLANSLDFWLPYLDIVAQQRMKALGRVRASDEQKAVIEQTTANKDARYLVERPLFGGDVWRGEGEAGEVTQNLVDHADQFGHLRAIIDAVKSHRVQDDFSDRWSWAKEDFERKLFKKRTKTKVVFVELNDTIPVHGPDAEVHADMFWQDLLAVCDERERRVVVCLRSGPTKVGDIARELGYANHSPVSKALTRIRQKATRLLGDD